MEEIKKWTALSKMESISEEMLLDRVTKAHQVKLPHQTLQLIPYIGTQEIVTYKTNELIALCPVTFLPDFYTLTISFVPAKKVLELKSLKFYLTDYKELPISHEHLADRIARDLKEQLEPEGFYIFLKTNIRGGIETIVEKGGSDEISNNNSD